MRLRQQTRARIRRTEEGAQVSSTTPVRQRTDKFPKTVYKFKIPGRRVAISCLRYGPAIDLHSLPRNFCRWANGGIAFGSFQRCRERKRLIMQNQPRVALAKNPPAGEGLEKTLQSHSPTSSAHRIGILMSQTGRFLECIRCRLSFAFPPGAHYDTIAKQFDHHLCLSTITRREGPKTSSQV
jgi:hypothetical protein